MALQLDYEGAVDTALHGPSLTPLLAIVAPTTSNLFDASKSGNELRVREALAAGGDPNAIHVNEQVSLHIACSSLHIAVYKGHDHIIPILVAAGADPNLRIAELAYNHDHKRLTPLMVALVNDLGDGMKKRRATVAALIAAGADVDAMISYAYWMQYTALTFALEKGCRASLLELLRAGASIHRFHVVRVPKNEDCFALLDKIDKAGGFASFAATQRAVPVAILRKIFALPHDVLPIVASFWMPRGGF